MQCPACQSENRPGRAACARCGAALTRVCRACGGSNEPGDRFCGRCGERLRDEAGEAVPRPARRPAAPGDIRPLSVLFCDLVGSTAHARRLGDEEWLAVTRDFQETCSLEVRRWGGHLAQYLGDGLLAYFGFPAISEDHAERAVHCGLALVEGVRRVGAALAARSGAGLEARVGIHTGRVVALEETGERPPVIGATVNLASRYERIAPPNGVVISEATYELVARRFEIEAFGEHRIRGVDAPVRAYRVVRALAPLPVRDALPPLVGRREELALLLARWERVVAGSGQVVTLVGDPGIGKSRLFEELHLRLAPQAVASGLARCTRYQQSSSFSPVVELVKQAIDWDEDDDEEERGRKLDAALARAELPAEQAVPAMREVLGLPPSPEHPPRDEAPELRRKLTLELLYRWLEASTRNGPIVIGIEDLQWADPSTLELVDLVIRGAHSMRIFLLLSFRSGFVADWGMPSHLTPVALPRLTQAEAEQVAARAASGAGLSHEQLAEIVRRADGLPLYVEELAKAVARGGAGEGDGASPTPMTLQGLLGSRLDSLGPAREMAQLVAVAGEGCSFELLCAVAGRDAAEVAALLDELVAAELLTQRGAPPQSRYSFKHELIRDAAYQALLRESRRELHGRMAREIERCSPAVARDAPERIARHYAGSDQPVTAVPYWRRAARRAVRSFAMEEASQHAWEALQLVALIPDREERLATELQLQLTRVNALAAGRGYGHASVEAPASRALELCAEVGDAAAREMLLALLSGHYMQRGDFRRTRELADELVASAEKSDHARMQALGHFVLGTALLWGGEYEAAVANCERGRRLYDPNDPAPSGVTATHPGVLCFGVGGLARWCLGYPDLALEEAEAGLRFARGAEEPHRYTTGWALTFKAQVLMQRREGEAMRECAEELAELASEHGFRRLEAWGRSLAAAGRLEAGDAAGMAALEEALDAHVDAEAGFWRAYSFAVLARGYAARGQTDEALTRLRWAQERAAATGERFYEGDLYRIEGDILAELGEVERAEASLAHAVELARASRARGWELRALTSLTRLRHAQGRAAETREALRALHDSFSEGHDTPDLREARALLQQLS